MRVGPLRSDSYEKTTMRLRILRSRARAAASATMDGVAPTNSEQDAAPDFSAHTSLSDVEEGGIGGECVEDPESIAAGKRTRATKIEAKQKVLLAARCRLQKLEEEREALVSALADNALNAAGKKKLEKAEERLPKAQQDVQRAQQELYDVELAQQKKVELQMSKRRRAAAASAAGETSGRMSEQGAIKLVELKLSREADFANTSDKTDSVWEHLHADWMALIEKGELPQSDARKKDALISRCAARHLRLSCVAPSLTSSPPPSPGTAQNSASSASFARGRTTPSSPVPAATTSTTSLPTDGARQPPRAPEHHPHALTTPGALVS